MCQAVALQMRNGTFFHPASSFVSSLRLMKLAFQLPPGPDTQTPKALKHPIHKVEQRGARQPPPTPPPTHVKNVSALDVSDKLAHAFIAYLLSNLQTCLFLHQQQTSIIQRCFSPPLLPVFIFSLTCLEVAH